MSRSQSQRDSNNCALQGSPHVAAKDPNKWRTLVRGCISKARVILTEGIVDKFKLLAARRDPIVGVKYCVF